MNELIQALSEIKEGDFQGEDENLQLKELKKDGMFPKNSTKNASNNRRKRQA